MDKGGGGNAYPQNVDNLQCFFSHPSYKLPVVKLSIDDQTDELDNSH